MTEPIFEQTVAESAPGEVDVAQPPTPTEYDENAGPDDVITNVVSDEDPEVGFAPDQSPEPDFEDNVDDEEVADGNR